VADQRGDPASVLHFCRDLIRLRTRLPTERLRLLGTSEGLLAWRRGEAIVAVNLGTASGEVAARGSIAFCTTRSREGEPVAGALTLSAREGAIVL
jgi:hypothetical protein